MPDPLVKENEFIDRMPDRSFAPNFPESRELLPEPFWDGHPEVLASYWEAWNLAFRNTKRVSLETGFVAPYIDTAFNDCLFMWDSVFILMFARYGERAFPFQKTMDNLYAKQHASGFISRQIREWNGEDTFHYSDPDSTGPNVLAWGEWEYFLQFGDRIRLSEVFPVILAYHRWMRRNRSWPDGSYWSTGWACGMDNQPRLYADSHEDPHGWKSGHDHDHMSWLDATVQALFSARILLKMGAELSRRDSLSDLANEANALQDYINEKMWNETEQFYVDRRRDGALSHVKSIGAFWTLIAEATTPERAALMAAHLKNPSTFGRPYPIPSLSADHPQYAGSSGGDYWRGGVWPSANYMVLRGLTAIGADALAHEIALKHLAAVTEVFLKTGTFWEDYSPEGAEPGKPAKSDFVGWGGLGPIAIFLEYVLGLRPDFQKARLIWDVRLTEAHGVNRYPIGTETVMSLQAAARGSVSEEPSVTIKTNQPILVELRWHGGSREIQCKP